MTLAPELTPATLSAVYEWVQRQRNEGVSWAAIRQACRDVPWQHITRWQFEEDQRLAALPPARPNAHIVTFIGPIGSGKSLAAAKLCHDEYLSGRPIIYNPKGLLKFPPIPGVKCEFMSLADIALLSEKLQGALIYVDEIQTHLSKFRQSTQAAFLFRTLIQQVRKRGIDMIATTNATDQLEGGLTQHISWHVKCRAHLPPDDMRDEVKLEYVDTHKRFGRGAPRFMRGAQVDDRLRFAARITHASENYRLYDSYAITDPQETLGLTADKLRQLQQLERLGVDFGWLCGWFRSALIPELVNKGVTDVIPSVLSDYIKERYTFGYDHKDCCGQVVKDRITPFGCQDGKPLEMDMSEETIGHAMARIGIPRKQTRYGKLYQFPAKNEVAAFATGELWTPKDTDF